MQGLSRCFCVGFFTHVGAFICSGEYAGSVGRLAQVHLSLQDCQWGQTGALKRGFSILRWQLSYRDVLFAWDWQVIWVTQVIHHSPDMEVNCQLLWWVICPPNTHACGKTISPNGHQQLKLALCPFLNAKDTGPWICTGFYDHPVHMLVLQQLTSTTCPCTGWETTDRQNCSSTRTKQCSWIAFGYPSFPVGAKNPLRMIPVCEIQVKPFGQGCSSAE